MSRNITSIFIIAVSFIVGMVFFVYAHPFNDIVIDNPIPKAGSIFGFGRAIFINDITGDGISDIAVGAIKGAVGGSGRVFIFNGSDQSLISTLDNPFPQFNDNFGVEVASIADVNSDNVPDIMIGASGHQTSTSGRVYVFSGGDGSVIHAIDNPFSDPTGANFGRLLTAIDDIDNDGVEDILIVSPTQDVTVVNEGQIFIFSGATGGLILVLNNFQPDTNSGFGNGIKRIDDINGDGFSDLFLGELEREIGAIQDAGQAHIYSGKDFTVLRTFVSPVPTAFGNFGNGGISLGDINGDNVSDIAINESVTGKIHVFSGQTSTLIYSISNVNPGSGQTIESAGDVNGDGIIDILVGAPNVLGGVGQAFIFNG